MRGIFSRNDKSSRIEDIRRSRADCIKGIKASHHEMMRLSDPMDRNGWMYDSENNDAAFAAICDRAVYFDDPIQYAAFILDYVNAFHPFTDGNKRMSLLLAKKVLGNDGHLLDDSEEVYTFIMMIAQGRYTQSGIEDWLREYLTRRACGTLPDTQP